MWERLADTIWQPWLLSLFLLTGLCLTLRSGFFQFRRVRIWLPEALGSLSSTRTASGGELTRRQAVATSLASTVGTGSVAGVATAICLGGPGAVLWMWVSALLGLMTGYVEKALAVRYRKKVGDSWTGGPFYWLAAVLHRPLAARWFALWCVLSALVGGAAIQSGSVAGALHAALGLPPIWSGLGTALAVGLVCLGGVSAVGRASERLAPLMTGLFLGAGLLALLLRLDRLPEALRSIWAGAFGPQSMAGGMAGAALRYGVARGVFTNEAGVGSSALAHAAAHTDDPVQEGYAGMLEVFFSTLLVCSVTALVILTSGVYTPGGVLTGSPLSAAAFTAVLGPAGAHILAVSVLLFALTSLLGWCWYGEQSLRQLSGWSGFTLPYRVLYLVCILYGSVCPTDRLWAISDICTAAMAAVTLPALLRLSPAVLER